MATNGSDKISNNAEHITEEDIKLIVSKYITPDEEATIKSYYVHIASNKMLGFLAEYFKVIVHLTNRDVLYFFIKAISKSNTAKAEMVKDMNLFEKESLFYSEIKRCIEIPGIDPWSPKYVTLLSDAIVFEDLNARQYKLRNKLAKFDMAHTQQALKTLARFHGGSIIFEETKKKEIKDYKISDDYSYVLDKGGYYFTCEWFIQCMNGALESMKVFSKYNNTEIKLIENQWHDIWSIGLSSLDNYHQGKVICHRDLWNNNLMFHYKEENDNVPDDCLIVDFQAARYQTLTSDVMLLLCCNLEPKFRETNMESFLNFYYEELRNILINYNISISNVINKEDFLSSAEKLRLWGLIVCACLLPQFWMDDESTTKYFSDSLQFNEILSKNKGLFIKTMMENNLDYRKNVMEIFEEIADRYCFKPDF